MMLRVTLFLALALASSACNAEPQASVPIATRSIAGLDIVPLTIEHGGKRTRFQVEVARTSEEQAKGLMFRESLPPNEGMIFPFPSPRMASFWMKNTFIPLDIVFIRSDGTITNIAENTVPQSLTPVSSTEPVAAVLEVAGGRTAMLGIKAGDKVRW